MLYLCSLYYKHGNLVPVYINKLDLTLLTTLCFLSCDMQIDWVIKSKFLLKVKQKYSILARAFTILSMLLGLRPRPLSRFLAAPLFI